MGQRPTLPMGLAAEQTGLAQHPRQSASPRRWCAVRVRPARGHAPAEGSPAVGGEEGFHGGHQCSEGTTTGKERAAGAHPRWPARSEGRSITVGVAFVGGEGLR
jgi:hypothetical protein